MSWFIKNPFGPDENPVKHLVKLLANEAERAGAQLTDQDREILSKESSPQDPVPEDLKQKAKELITRIFDAEPDEFERDPKSFSDSLQWAGAKSYPNIVAIAEEVLYGRAGTRYPQLQGWRLAKDRMLLIISGVLVVFLMFAIVIAGHFLFGWN